MSISYPPLVEILDGMAAATEEGNQAARAVIRELNRLQGQVKEGELGKLAETLNTLTDLGKQLGESLTELAAKLPFDPATYLASGAYLDEVRAALEAQGVTVVAEENTLLCSPSIIRAVPREVAIDIDGTRERRLDPRTVTANVIARQRQGSKYRPERFLNSLRQSYDLVVAKESERPDAVIRLVDIWQVLTLLPGQQKEYTQQDFARDLYHLDASGVTTSLQSARQLRWCASSGIRNSGVLCVVGADGRLCRYWGVSFVEPHAHPGS
jgi:hypothetical protein